MALYDSLNGVKNGPREGHRDSDHRISFINEMFMSAIPRVPKSFCYPKSDDLSFYRYSKRWKLVPISNSTVCSYYERTRTYDEFIAEFYEVP